MVWLLVLPLVWWAALLLADSVGPDRNLMVILELLTEKLDHPLEIHFTEYTGKSLLACTLLYGMGIGIFYSNQKNYRRGEEHGSAKWGNVGQLCKKYRAIRDTEDGGAPAYDYAQAPLAHDLPVIDETRSEDYELLSCEDIAGEPF